jgi:hypothetical protein
MISDISQASILVLSFLTLLGLISSLGEQLLSSLEPSELDESELEDESRDKSFSLSSDDASS